MFKIISHLLHLVETTGKLVEVDGRLTRELLGVELELEELDADEPVADPDHPEYRALMLRLPGIERVLRRDPGTRRAVVHLHRAGVDCEELECLTLVQFLLRSNSLKVHCYARSLDVRGKLPRDVAALRAVAQVLAARLGVASGGIRLSVASAHVYV